MLGHMHARGSYIITKKSCFTKILTQRRPTYCKGERRLQQASEMSEHLGLL